MALALRSNLNLINLLSRTKFDLLNKVVFCKNVSCYNVIITRHLSDKKWKLPSMSLKFNKDDKFTKMTHKERLKEGLANYGPALIVVHIGISLISLGFFYTVIKLGFDATKFVDEDTAFRSPSKLIVGAGTFVAAYTIHKSIMPFRIILTLFLTPGLVRFLRAKGIMKKK